MIRAVARAYYSAFSGLPRDVWLLAGVALVNRAGSMVLVFLSLWLTRSIGIGVAEAGRVLSLYGLGAIAGGFIGGWLSDRIGPLRAQQASLVLSGVGFLWVSQLRTVGAISVAMGLFGGMFTGALLNAISDPIPDNHLFNDRLFFDVVTYGGEGDKQKVISLQLI